MSCSYKNLSNGSRGGEPTRRRRTERVSDENAAPDNMSMATRSKSQQLAGLNRGTSSVSSAGHRHSKKRVCDENAAPNNGIVANHPKSRPLATSNHGTSVLCYQRKTQACGETDQRCELRSRNSSSRAFRDLTNTGTECLTSVDTAKSQRLANSQLRGTPISCLSGRNEPKRQCQLSVPASHHVRRQRLPSAVIAKILEMAGFKFDRSECEYVDTIIKSDLQREAQNMPRRGFMLEQRSLNGRMRAILVDWIAQVLDMSKFSRRTLFLTVSLVDRCLCSMPVDRSNLQLLGSTAFLIAAKVEEIYPPEVNNLVYVCDGAYTTEQLLSMECTILLNLDFRTDGPTVEHFLPHLIAASQSRNNLGPDPILANGLASLWHFSAASDSDECRNGIAWYLAELALLDVHMSNYPPSQVSASALYLANNLIKQVKPGGNHTELPNLWDDTLVQISGYTEPMLLRCVDDLDRLRTAALSDTLQQINKRHADAVNAIRHATFQPGNHSCSGSSPYAVVAPVVPYPC